MIGTKERVLIIEDQGEVAGILANAVNSDNSLHFDCFPVPDLASAFSYLQKQKVDVILTDLNLPDSRGYETFRQLYSRYPSIPIVVVTAESNQRLALDLITEGAQDCLIKGQLDIMAIGRALKYAIIRSKK